MRMRIRIRIPIKEKILGSVEAQSGALEGRGDHSGGKEVQNGGVEAENGALDDLYTLMRSRIRIRTKMKVGSVSDSK
jgi:hypothetical protein